MHEPHKPAQSVTHFAPTEQRRQQQNVMCGYVGAGDDVTIHPDAVTCLDCRDWIGPQTIPSPTPPVPPPPARKVSIDELQRILERDSDVPLQILPNGEIREAETGERTERKPLTMRENLGGEYALPPVHFAQSESHPLGYNTMCCYASVGCHVTTDPAAVTCPDCRAMLSAPAFKLEDPCAPKRPKHERAMVGPEDILGSSFSVPVELAAQYKYGSYSPPEHILGSPEFEQDLQAVLNEPVAQNSIREDLPPPQSMTVEEVIAATQHVPPPRRARLDLAYYRPHQVLAIAASLVADFPGMFAGPDILSSLRVPLDVERYRPTPPPPIVVDADLPPLEKRPGHRSGYKVASEAHHAATGGKPAGSKLARKAARGKL